MSTHKPLDGAAGDVQSPAPATDRTSRLQSLLERVHTHRERVAQPAQRLSVELDGVVVATSDLDLGPFAIALPHEARSATMRDECGVPRAHVMIEQNAISPSNSSSDARDKGAQLSFDHGRIRVSFETSPNPTTPRRLVIHASSSAS